MSHTYEEFDKHRPAWWLKWQDYPHTTLSITEARGLNKYCVWLETQLAERVERLEAELVETQKAYNNQAHCGHLLSNKVDALEKQNRKLVEALQLVRRIAKGPTLDYTEVWNQVDAALARATGPAEELHCKRCGAHVASACTCAGPAAKEGV